MEATEITCPQCGLVNNYLADACAQCGIIFVKNPAMLQVAQSAQDQEKSKATEAAEAKVDETQPSSAAGAPALEPIKRPDPHEDTVEMVIPAEKDIPQTEAQPSGSAERTRKDHQDEDTAEIEIEAIETAMEAVTEPTDAETLFLTEVKADQPVEQAAAEASVKPADTPSEPQQAKDPNAGTDQSGSTKEVGPDPDAKDTAAKPPEAELDAHPHTQESPVDQGSENREAEAAAPAEADTSGPKPLEAPESEGKPTPQEQTPPAEKDMALQEKSETAPVEQGATPTEGRADTPQKKAEADVLAKEQVQKAKNDALKKQLEAQAKAEARKEEAAKAQAAALKKKKLEQAKAEALKKQKAALAKAEAKKKAAHDKALAEKKNKADQAQQEALKKQKDAQAKAEASAREMQVASSGAQAAASTLSGESLSHHDRLLELLKRYRGKAIGINYDNSAEIKAAELVEANEEFFSIKVKDKELQFSYPLKTILTIIEGQNGVETGEDDKKAKFDAVIKVYPLVLF